MATNIPVQTLLQLDKSSPQFPNQLSDAIARREFDGSILRLQDSELESVIEYLDEVPSFNQSQSSSH
jgi:hypothetical protein